MATIIEERDALKAQVGELQSKLVALEAEKKTAADALASANQSLQNEGEKSAAADKKILSLQGEITAANDKVAKLEAEKQTVAQAAAAKVASLGISQDKLPDADPEGSVYAETPQAEKSLTQRCKEKLGLK